MRLGHTLVLSSGLLVDAHQSLAMAYQTLGLFAVKTFSRLVLGEQFFMLIRLCLHFFGGIFIMLCQGVLITSSFSALNSLGHVHGHRVYRAGNQKTEDSYECEIGYCFHTIP